MKRLLLLLYVALLLPSLAGCGTLFSSRRDMEHLRPVQTLGIDREGDALLLSVSTGIGPNGDPPLVLSDHGTGIETALTQLQNDSPEDEIFCAHVRYLLVGDRLTADDIAPVLQWIERSPTMRMNTPLFAVRGRAADAVTASGETTDITMLLASLEREEQSRGQHIYTLLETASSLYERGCALCLAVDLRPAEGTVTVGSDAGITVVPAGYAVLKNGAVLAYLTEEESLGTMLLTRGVNGAQADAAGNTLSLAADRAAVTVLRDGDTPVGLSVECELRAGVLERAPGGETDPAAIEAALAEEAEGWLLAAVSRAQALACDFPGLGDTAGKKTPRDAEKAAWDAVFPTLPVTATVRAHIEKSYDLTDE